MSEQISLSELKERKEKAEARANKAQDLAKELSEKIEALDSAHAPARMEFLENGIAKILKECGWTMGELIEKIGGEAKPTGSKKTKRVSHPSPTLVNPNNPSQTCKSKGRQPEWSTALKAQGTYRLSTHVRDSIPHLDEENANINRAWLSRDAFNKS
jgi:hypothetical protein|tara:strand:- start:156 stop:626 length:471 start_codon:yes stop_codon:yes gene_type:complete